MKKEPEPKSRPEANIIFSHSAGRYANSFSGVTIGYRVSEGSVTEAMLPELKALRDKQPQILEVGAGTGQSTLRILRVLEEEDLGNFGFFSTEYNPAMIRAGKVLNEERAKKQEPEISFVPMAQATAEALPFPDGKFDVVYGSQVIHWIGNIPAALSEAYRVLRPGGIVVHAGSGIIEGFGDLHFTENPVYKLFLGKVEEELRFRGYWDDTNGEFTPKNNRVNPFFHRYAFEDVSTMLKEAGFTDIERTYHAVPIDKSEMLARMSAGATSMFIFAGGYAKNISAEERAEIVDKARNEALQENPELFDNLDQNPTGDPTVLFKARKPQ